MVSPVLAGYVEAPGASGYSIYLFAMSRTLCRIIRHQWPILAQALILRFVLVVVLIYNSLQNIVLQTDPLVVDPQWDLALHLR